MRGRSGYKRVEEVDFVFRVMGSYRRYVSRRGMWLDFVMERFFWISINVILEVEVEV